MKSLSLRFLLGVGVTSVTITLLSAVATFNLVRADMAQRQTEHLEQYLDQRAVNVSRRFDAITNIHRKAVEDLTRRLETLPPERVSGLLDAHYPLQADGTRRSRPEDFDGKLDADGDRISGLGAFLADGRAVDPTEGAALASAFHVVHDFGQGISSSYDNFYFATPHNRVVIFAPSRPDRLMFYRHDAPPSLDFASEEMMRMVSPGADPTGRTRCTSLQNYIQEPNGKRLATACMTPFTYKGRYLGAFGSSLQLHDYLATAVNSGVPHADTLILRAQGDAIAATGAKAGEAMSPQGLARIDRQYSLKPMFAAVRADGRAKAVVTSPDGRYLVGFSKIAGPDWWLLIVYPWSEIEASALRSASWILGLGLLGALLQTALIVGLARRAIAKPLQRLAESCNTDAPTNELRGRGDEIGVLGRALHDERAKTQAILASLEERVAERTAELERASTEKDRFLANMSHELRTPLNGVIAVSETLAGLQRSRRARDMAHLIVSSSRLLEHVLSDILDVSRLQAGEVQLNPEPFDLATVLEHVAGLHRAVAEPKGLELAWHIEAEAQGRYLGDPVRLTQVVSNLLSNAVKFTERGRVELRAAQGPSGLVLTVLDTGIGFDAHAGARLFGRFEQADPSISRRFGGSGLGLAICRSLTEAMGGTIRAASAPGFGSVFTVELPLPRTGAEPAAARDEADGEDAALAGVRVLLAEDHPTNQKVVQLILEAAGVELTVVGDGREALSAMNGGGFDLVLMDMQMPDMDGLSATRLLRETEAALRLPRTPVVMLTANALGEHVEASLKAGADRHLAKPIRAAELLAVVETLTDGAPVRARAA